MKAASHCCWCPLPRMPSPAISKAISRICSCWHCDYLPWQLKPLAPNRASDAMLMTLCPPSRAVLLPIYELLEPWWCASGEKHQTCQHQSCHSRDYHRCWSSPPQLRDGPQVNLLSCPGCSAQIRKNCFLPSLSCAFLHYYQCNPALYLECLSNFEWKENFFPLFPWNWARDHLSDRPRVLLRITFPSSEYRSFLLKQACGMVLLFQTKFFSGHLISLNG